MSMFQPIEIFQHKGDFDPKLELGPISRYMIPTFEVNHPNVEGNQVIRRDYYWTLNSFLEARLQLPAWQPSYVRLVDASTYQRIRGRTLQRLTGFRPTQSWEDFVRSIQTVDDLAINKAISTMLERFELLQDYDECVCPRHQRSGLSKEDDPINVVVNVHHTLHCLQHDVHPANGQLTHPMSDNILILEVARRYWLRAKQPKSLQDIARLSVRHYVEAKVISESDLPPLLVSFIRNRVFIAPKLKLF